MRPASAEESARVDALDERGRGVAEVAGRPVYIHGALPGERVTFVRQRRRRRDQAAVATIADPAPTRCAPRCPHFDACGGCALQHLSHPAQIVRKAAILEHALAAHGVAAGRVRPAIVAPPWAYRRKARLGARYVEKKGGVLLGFRERHAPYVADIAICEILVEPVGRRIPALRAALGAMAARAAIPQVEVAAGDERCALVVRHLVPLEPGDRAILRDFGREHDLDLYLQPAGPDTVTPLDGPPPAPLRYALPGFGVVLEFEPTDFVQVNARVNRALVSSAVDALALTGRERVLDLFCGLGNFTLPVATRAGEVLGLEGDAGLVARGRDNARRNGCTNAVFEARDLHDPAVVRQVTGGGWDRVLLDPPRSGAEAVIAGLPEPLPPRVVYVSCNPHTLAGDAGLLVARGYRLLEAGVVDMFPHTAHGESIAVFARAS